MKHVHINYFIRLSASYYSNKLIIKLSSQTRKNKVNSICSTEHCRLCTNQPTKINDLRNPGNITDFWDSGTWFSREPSREQCLPLMTPTVAARQNLITTLKNKVPLTPCPLLHTLTQSHFEGGGDHSLRPPPPRPIKLQLYNFNEVMKESICQR